ncbi:hypothetical protein ECANGB1_2654 [Enterospora canceri]|uniref:Uncharacterized protein n=1 Tax=Enterospora canceri TaxID=1081671 RepID=A0A1Y1S6M0_9MICR|nr:hypothetical protein ECANGB1_2654 [Enterospora canceri]
MIKTALYVLLNLFVLASEEKKESEPGKVEPSEEPSTSEKLQQFQNQKKQHHHYQDGHKEKRKVIHHRRSNLTNKLL